MLAAGAACGVDSAFCASTPLQISSRRTPAIKRYGISRVPGNLKTHRFYRARPPATQAEHERYSCKSQKHTKGLTLCYDSGLSVLAFPGTPMSDRSARLHALQQALKERILILDGGMEELVYEVNVEGARVARKVADAKTLETPDKPRFVAGVLGPTSRTCSLSPDVNNPGYRNVTFDELVENYTEATRGLIEGGADLILIETIFDTLNAKAAIFAVQGVFEEVGFALPIMISGTITDASGRTLSGQTTEAFWNSVSHAKPISVGLNCALGAADLRPYLEELSNKAGTHVSAHPNAGLPNEFGEYDELPAETAKVIEEFAQSGFLNIVGGCCGTTPGHIEAIAKAVAGYAPREIPEIPKACRLSGLEPFTIDRSSLFVNVGERTNITGPARFARRSAKTTTPKPWKSP